MKISSDTYPKTQEELIRNLLADQAQEEDGLDLQVLEEFQKQEERDSLLLSDPALAWLPPKDIEKGEPLDFHSDTNVNLGEVPRIWEAPPELENFRGLVAVAQLPAKEESKVVPVDPNMDLWLLFRKEQKDSGGKVAAQVSAATVAPDLSFGWDISEGEDLSELQELWDAPPPPAVHLTVSGKHHPPIDMLELQIRIEEGRKLANELVEVYIPGISITEPTKQHPLLKALNENPWEKERRRLLELAKQHLHPSNLYNRGEKLVSPENLSDTDQYPDVVIFDNPEIFLKATVPRHTVSFLVSHGLFKVCGDDIATMTPAAKYLHGIRCGEHTVTAS